MTTMMARGLSGLFQPNSRALLVAGSHHLAASAGRVFKYFSIGGLIFQAKYNKVLDLTHGHAQKSQKHGCVAGCMHLSGLWCFVVLIVTAK